MSQTIAPNVMPPAGVWRSFDGGRPEWLDDGDTIDVRSGGALIGRSTPARNINWSGMGHAAADWRVSRYSPCAGRWLHWGGSTDGENTPLCPFGMTMSVMLRNGEVITKASPRRVDWCYLTTGTHGRDIIAYCFAPVEVAAAPESESAPIEVAPHPDAQSAPIGGKLPDDSYYIVEIKEPMSPGLKPCVVECADIIEALDLTFNEGEAFKAIWRLGKTRQGVGKAGNSLQYEADKVGHYGTRVAIQTKRSTG